jgi:hypothetical protein
VACKIRLIEIDKASEARSGRGTTVRVPPGGGQAV